MCADIKCMCWSFHTKHNYQPYEQFMDSISRPRVLSQDFDKGTKLMQGFLNDAARLFQELARLHERLTEKHLEKYFKQSLLRRKLINRLVPEYG